MGGVNEDVPLVCVCGNHDIGDKPNRKTIGKMNNNNNNYNNNKNKITIIRRSVCMW